MTVPMTCATWYEEKCHVRLAEDGQDHGALLRRESEQDGSFTADVGEDGLACLDKFAQASYDVFLLDYNLPKADGPGGSVTC